jgi:hypothetical protein
VFHKAISIGVSCQPAKQIRTILGQTEAYFFDWMIAPLPAMLKAVESDFAGMLQPQNLSYSDSRKIRVEDSANGLQYQHDFPADESGMVLPGFADHADAVREKYLRRAMRTKEVINSGEPILLVRYVQVQPELTESARASVVRLFAERFPKGRLSFLWASPLIEGFNRTDGGYLCHVPYSPKWDGDEAGWRAAFDYVRGA